MDRLVVAETMVANERPPRVETQRETDPGAKKRAAPPSRPPRCDKDVRGALPVGVVGRHDLVIAGIREHMGEDLFVGLVVLVHLHEAGAEPLQRVGDCFPASGIGQRVAVEVGAAAGPEKRQLVRKVAVDGDTTDARSVGDVADRGRRRTDRPVELDSGVDDAPASAVLLLRTAPEAVFASHRLMIHAVSRNLTGYDWGS